MKKLLISICLIFVTTAFAMMGCNNKVKENYQSADIGYITLNGIDSASAVKMISHFDSIKQADPDPLPASIWFSKQIIHDIDNLLTAERDSDIAHKNPKDKDKMLGVTDGIRVYFICEPTASDPHFTTTVALVSTKDDGKSASPDSISPSGRLHLDYYKHSLDSSLFKIGDIRGQICHGGKDCVGDSLYIKTNDPSEEICSMPHAISRSTGEQMVQDFSHHYINTIGEWFELSFWQRLDNDPKCNGIRFYFATNEKSTNAEYSLRDAFVITTTSYSTQSGANVDYFDCPPLAGKKPITLPPQDNGELCPSNCNPQ